MIVSVLFASFMKVSILDLPMLILSLLMVLLHSLKLMRETVLNVYRITVAVYYFLYIVAIFVYNMKVIPALPVEIGNHVLHFTPLSE